MDAKDYITKAKISIIRGRMPFYASLIYSLGWIEDKTQPTMAIDATNIYYNPEYVCKLGKNNKLVFDILHELEHYVLKHPLMFTEQKDLDKYIYNVAADFIINDYLIQYSNTLNTDNRLKYHDESTLHWSKEKKYSKYKYGEMSIMEVYQDLLKNKKNNQQLPKISHIKSGAGKGKEQQLTQQQIQQIKRQIDSNIIKAVQEHTKHNKDIGDLSLGVQQIYNKLTNPILDWKTILFKYVQAKARDDYSRTVINKRYYPYLLPSLYSEAIDNITICIDTSGSITAKELVKMLSEVKSISNTFNIATIRIIQFDTKVTFDDKYQSNFDPKQIELLGGGGTNITPIIKLLNKDNSNKVVIVFTDMCFYESKEKPKNYDIIFIDIAPENNKNYSHVKDISTAIIPYNE